MLPPALEDIPNIGKALAADLRAIGIRSPDQLDGVEPLDIYRMLEKQMGARHDPCVLYTLLAVQSFMKSGLSAPWYQFTEQGKSLLHPK